MDIILIVIGIVLLIIGLLGCVLPIIPGPPISYLGMVMLQLTERGDFSATSMVLFAAIAIAVTVLDFIVPIWGTKRMGGSKAGTWGATIGLLLGVFFFPPLGLIIGPLIGAVIGELTTGKDFEPALKSGLGSFLGFLMGTGMKLAVSIVITYKFFKELI